MILGLNWDLNWIYSPRCWDTTKPRRGKGEARIIVLSKTEMYSNKVIKKPSDVFLIAHDENAWQAAFCSGKKSIYEARIIRK